MRLSTSLLCAFFAASSVLVACGGSDPEEEGTAVRPDDTEDGDAGTGGTSSKGGSAGKGGTSAKGGTGGSSGTGGTGGTGGASGSGGSAGGTGGSSGSTSGSGGSAGSTTGGSSGSSTGGSAGNGTGGSAGGSAGTGGNAGTSAGGKAGADAGGSAGASAGSGGNAGTSAGTGGNAGTSSGGNAGMSAGGSAGAGGAPACTDGYSGNFAFGKAFSLGGIGDSDSATKVSGKVPGEQIDWYKYDGLDKASPIKKVNPNVTWSAAQNVKVCMYFKCTGGKDWGSECDAGTPATAQNMKGCCSTEGEIEVGAFSCCDGAFCSDDASVWVSVEAKSASNACASYDIDVAYGTGLSGAPLPGDGSEPGPTP